MSPEGREEWRRRERERYIPVERSKVWYMAHMRHELGARRHTRTTQEAAKALDCLAGVLDEQADALERKLRGLDGAAHVLESMRETARRAHAFIASSPWVVL